MSEPVVRILLMLFSTVVALLADRINTLDIQQGGKLR